MTVLTMGATELALGKAPVWSWLPVEDIEPDTLVQIANLANLPPTTHVAVMPDAHKGYGMPIGCALATRGAVVPYAVGVDIGCGMVAVRTSVKADEWDRDAIRAALVGIYARVPVGQPTKQNRNAGSHIDPQNSRVLASWLDSRGARDPESLNIKQRADRQLGTLGGGNHFIELQTDGSYLWLMLHTGSRTFGKWLCDHYHKTALRWCERYYTPLPDKELAFLSLDSEDGRDYLIDMGFGLRFAEESRARIEAASIEAMREVFGDLAVEERIETHHNFAAIEKHLGKDVVVHRKGAVSTVGPIGSANAVGVALTPRSVSDGNGLAGFPPQDRENSVLVTIPGSMQTGSYIGRGIPSKLALNTCSHGAGRRLGRNQTRRDNVGVDIKAEMEAEGIVLVCPPESDALDEAGRAYKDIENVMVRQADLVAPVYRLRPLGVVKG